MSFLLCRRFKFEKLSKRRNKNEQNNNSNNTLTALRDLNNKICGLPSDFRLLYAIAAYRTFFFVLLSVQ